MSGIFKSQKEIGFRKAVPVFPELTEKRNVAARFTLTLPILQDPVLALCAADLCRVSYRGEIVYWGPSRAAEGCARLSLVPLRRGGGTLEIVVLSYGIHSYCAADGDAFLQAEIRSGDRTFFPTEPGTGDWRVSLVGERLSKTQRISFQRAFTECWRLPAHDGDTALPLVEVPAPRILPDRTCPPSLVYLPAIRILSEGTFERREEPWHEYRDRSLVGAGRDISGYPQEELDVCLTEEADHFVFSRKALSAPDRLCAGEYRVYGLALNYTGLVSIRVNCLKPAVLYVFMDERVRNGDIQLYRMGDVANMVRYDLEPGEHVLETLEPFTTHALKLALTQGEILVRKAGLTEIASSARIRRPPKGLDGKLRGIWNAAVESFRQNAVDLFMDCPSRERAGWLCDSFFTARAERCLTGRSDVERSFLENYLLSRENGQLPRGMLPMCYPASHPNGVFIPNWAMWLVLELEEYAARTEDLDTVKAFRPRLDALISYLDGFCNEDGLLERLPSWVFVEWSRANEWVQDVNYPSNMLYARVLQAYDALYGSPEHAVRAREMREKIMSQSYDGIFFRDHAVRLPDGGLQVCPDRSEAAQYYAFFTGLCTPETLPELWKILLADFGPSRSGRFEDVAPANAFVGDYMRLDLLCRYGETKRLLAEMRAFFGPMARQTGTLWENLTDHASLCHGFASCAAVWLCETFDPKRQLS